MKLILASGSPRRRELLSLYTTDFAVCASDFDEKAVRAENPAALAGALARGKCLAVSGQHPGCLVVGSDTVVEVDGEVFGKPKESYCQNKRSGFYLRVGRIYRHNLAG